MAAPQQSDRDRQVQVAVAQAIIPLIQRALSLIDVHRIAETLPRFRVVLQAIVDQYGAATVRAASLQYVRDRALAGVTSPPPAFTAPQVTPAAMDDAVTWGIAPLYGPQPDRAATQDRLSLELEQLVLDQSRDATEQAVRDDDDAVGWARVPKPGACAFCMMLATRGPVYRSRRTGGETTLIPAYRDPSKPTENRYHPGCRCILVPVFGSRDSFEPTAAVRDAQALWVKVAKPYSGRDARIRFRQAYEGREVTGPLTKPYRVKH